MKYLFLAALAFPLTCLARLGEDENQLVARYGEIQQRKDDVLSFEKNNFLIQVTMIDGKAESIAYANKQKGVPLSGDQVEDLLQKNFPPPNNKLVIDKEESTADKCVFRIPNASAFYDVKNQMLILITAKGLKTKIKEIVTENQKINRVEGL